MTEDHAIALIAAHGCRLLPGNADVLHVVNEQLHFHYRCQVSDLACISTRDFVSVITTGHTPSGSPALRGVYREYRKQREESR